MIIGLVLGVCWVVSACGQAPTETAGVSTPPNVMILLVDTLRADHVGCYGYSRDTTPNLDAFAEDSVLFARVTSQAPWTNPAVASLLSSLYPSTHHLMSFKEGDRVSSLSPSVTTLAEVLADNGYRTAAFTANPWIRKAGGFDQGFDVFEGYPVLETGEGEPAPELNKVALEWLETGGSKPFFLFVHYMDVHGPYTPPEPYRSLFHDPDREFRLLTESEQAKIPRYLKIPGADTLDAYIDRYDGQIRFWDEEFGRFVDRLSAAGHLDNTLVVVTADHGEEFLDHGRFNHGITLYEEQTRVPLVWRPTSGGGPRQVVKPRVELVDVMPTILARIGIEGLADLQGDDLSPLLDGDVWEPHPCFSEATVKGGGRRPKDVMKAVHQGNIKTIVNVTKDQALAFDLDLNPTERIRIARSEALPTAAGLAAVERWMEINAALGVRFPSTLGDHDPELLDQLEALGYIE